ERRLCRTRGVLELDRTRKGQAIARRRAAGDDAGARGVVAGCVGREKAATDAVAIESAEQTAAHEAQAEARPTERPAQAAGTAVAWTVGAAVIEVGREGRTGVTDVAAGEAAESRGSGGVGRRHGEGELARGR